MAYHAYVPSPGTLRGYEGIAQKVLDMRTFWASVGLFGEGPLTPILG